MGKALYLIPESTKTARWNPAPQASVIKCVHVNNEAPHNEKRRKKRVKCEQLFMLWENNPVGLSFYLCLSNNVSAGV